MIHTIKTAGIKSAKTYAENIQLLTQEGKKECFDNTMSLEDFIMMVTNENIYKALCGTHWIFKSAQDDVYFTVSLTVSNPYVRSLQWYVLKLEPKDALDKSYEFMIAYKN